MHGGKGSTEYTVGYKYYVGMHMALCHGPVDALRRIRVDDKVAWEGVHTAGRLSINKPDLFGGESREGGISGDIDFAQGGPIQGQNDYLAAQVGNELLPAFRGVCCAVLRRMYMGINPYLKQWEWRVQRIHTSQNGAVQWYDEKAEIPVYVEIITPGRLAWRYKVVAVADTSDYSAKGYDDSGWSLGYSPFADKPWTMPGDYNFPTVPSTVVPQQKKVWVRATITIEGSVPDSFFFDAFVDNGVEVWINGVKALSNYEVWGHYYSAYIPGSYFVVGANQITVLGRDDSLGVRDSNWFWFDLRLQDTSRPTSDMNPAHIIRECLTNSEWGMGYPEADIDDDAFMAAADRLYAESMGISILWDTSSDIESFLTDIIRHIDASIYVDRSTGKFVLKLIRGGYDESSLLELNESNVLRIENFTRQTMAEVVNEVVVKYWDSKDGQTKTGTIQDIALIQALGGITSATVDYPGFTNATVAYRVAQRDLKALSTPRVSCVIYTNRQAHVLNIGDVFRLSWPQFGVNSMIMRVSAISLGGPTNNEIRIDCSQDVFDLPDMQLIADTGTPWQSPSLPPKVITDRIVFEAPYFEIVQQLGQTAVDDRLLELPEAGYIGIAAVRPNAVSIAARIYTDSGAGYAEHGSVDFCPSATLSAAIGYTNTVITISEGVDLDLVEVGTWAQIDDELVAIDAISDTSITIRRGVLDTVPASHTAGARLFFWDAYSAGDRVEYVAGEEVGVKLLTVTGSGVLALSEAPINTVTLNERAIRPYPPGNVQVNGARWPASIGVEDELAVTWAHRDRTQQTSGTLQDYTYGDIGPEPGTTYAMRIYHGQTNALLRTVTGLTGTSYTYLKADEIVEGGGTLTEEPYWAQTVLALPLNGDAGATTFTDLKGHAVSRAGNTVIATTPSGPAAYFDGAGDRLYSTSADYALGTGDFTIEFFLRPTGTGSDNYARLIQIGSNSATGGFWLVRSAASSPMDFLMQGYSGGYINLAPAGVIAGVVNDTRVHMAVCRIAGVFTVYVAGTLKATGASYPTYAITQSTVNIGSNSSNTESLQGYIDNVRITKGVARYTENFTPPTQEIGQYIITGGLSPALRVELESVRGGLASLQKWDLSVTRG